MSSILHGGHDGVCCRQLLEEAVAFVALHLRSRDLLLMTPICSVVHSVQNSAGGIVICVCHPQISAKALVG